MGKNSTQKNKTVKRVGVFAIIGIILALFNFIIYTFLARVVMNTNELLWLDSIIAYILATILAYFLHSKITWKERYPGKSGIVKFFVWGIIVGVIVSPFFTWLFQLIAPLYKAIFNLSISLNLPLDYNFIESTSIFILTTCVTMILNYLFYDKLVFGSTKDAPVNAEIEGHPKVSIIVPIYNTEKYLKKCLNSIVGQTYQNLEIILVDDGSTDNSDKIADDYAKNDKRIKAIHQKNSGQSAARNTGLKKATGDYIGFTDSDDEIKPTFTETLLKLYSKNTSIAVCGHQYHRIKENSSKNLYQSPLRPRRKSESQKAYILQLLARDGRMYSCNNKLFRASPIKEHNLTFNEKLNFSEDTNFVLDYLTHAKGEIAYTPEPLYIYNFGTDSSTVKTSATIWGNWQSAYQNLKTWLGPHPTFSEKFWLHVVHLRWRISFVRSKRRAKT